MEILQNIRIIAIPSWVKIIIYILLTVLFVFNIYIGASGVFEHGMKDWAEAATNLMGVLLPIIIISILFSFSHSGIDALKEKTESLLASTLPEYLSRIAEENGEFYDPRTTSIPKDKKQRHSLVTTNLHKNRCYCDYKIKAPDLCQHGNDSCDITHFKEIVVRVELNVRKVNFNLFLEKDNIEKNSVMKHGDKENVLGKSSKIFELFHHSSSGSSGLSQENTGNDYITYRFNNTILERHIGGKLYYCIVATANLKPDFLWDPSEKLYFCQDMMFMVRSFYSENPNLFSSTNK
ncbi:hypothetical protein [Thalassospira lucentensis]|uniref:hypothetical protein n=1 Tax=Thalassospira lucentensis TaxID=168935 RepID=UPI00142E526F|nr:hypothetical protein [Thalassospira lucentensis]NIZ00340.1 hypothetical protein [Thalassospira lucentensis]